MICCDGNRSTPFCPMCGRSLEAEPLQTLKAYLRSHKGQLERRLKILQSRRQQEEDNEQHIENAIEHIQNAIESCKRHIFKWSGWLNAIENMNKRNPSIEK